MVVPSLMIFQNEKGDRPRLHHLIGVLKIVLDDVGFAAGVSDDEIVVEFADAILPTFG